jgi:hypothetical protein
MTLMEALLASTMLAMGASAVLLPFSAGAQNEQEDARRTLALSFGREMMEEILSKPFDDPQGSDGMGPDSGESGRVLFDNIDDFDGYEDGYNKSISRVVGRNNETIGGVATEGLQREVVVRYIHVAGQDLGEDANFVRVEVIMSFKGNELLTLRRMVHKPQ